MIVVIAYLRVFNLFYSGIFHCRIIYTIVTILFCKMYNNGQYLSISSIEKDY